MGTVYVVYDERYGDPGVDVSDISCDSVTISFDYGEYSTRIVGVFFERWKADLCAAQECCFVAEAPFDGGSDD